MPWRQIIDNVLFHCWDSPGLQSPTVMTARLS